METIFNNKDANYRISGIECEINRIIKLLPAKSTGHPYMEGHHVVPLKYQNKFNNSLDVYANIICLCPDMSQIITLWYFIGKDKCGE